MRRTRAGRCAALRLSCWAVTHIWADGPLLLCQTLLRRRAAKSRPCQTCTQLAKNAQSGSGSPGAPHPKIKQTHPDTMMQSSAHQPGISCHPVPFPEGPAIWVQVTGGDLFANRPLYKSHCGLPNSSGSALGRGAGKANNCQLTGAQCLRVASVLSYVAVLTATERLRQYQR